MKKRYKAIFAVAAAMLASASVIGCAGDNYKSVKFAPQDTSYSVTSQGGSTVAYGNYIYFINGTRGYDDPNGDANNWSEVVKGGLYRAELNGTVKEFDGYNSFTPVRDAESGLEFKFTESKDYFDNDINVVDVTAIAPKTVGVTGDPANNRGGIFIYDNYVYFASPNNLKNSAGAVQTTRTDFFMMPLNGGKPSKIYTTSEGVDTSSAEYAFYKFGGTTYLVVNEGGTVVSVKIDTKKAKADETLKFEVNATGVYFPVRDTYYTGIDNNTVEDFIYYTRAVSDKENDLRAGTVIEAMRPDGSENFTAVMDSYDASIESVRDGVLFYRSKNSLGNDVIRYDNLHDSLVEFSPTYRAAHENDTSNIAGDLYTLDSSITATYAFRPDTQSNEVYLIGMTSSGINLYKSDNTHERLCSTTGTIKFVDGNYLYIAGSNSDLYRVPIWENMDGFGESVLLAEGIAATGVNCDYAAGYLTYYAEVDEWASDYTFFYKIDGYEGAEPQFVGQRSSADIPTEEQIEEKLKGSSDEE